MSAAVQLALATGAGALAIAHRAVHPRPRGPSQSFSPTREAALRRIAALVAKDARFPR